MPCVARAPAVARRVLLGLLLLAAVLGLVRAVTDATDLDGFHEAARHLADTGRFSGAPAVERYPPSFQALLLPLAPLPLGLAAALVLAASAWALLRLPAELQRLGAGGWERQWPAWAVAAPFLVDNLLLAQWAPLLLLLTLRGVRLAREGRGVAAGGLLGLALLLKPVVLPLLAAPLVLGWRGPGAVRRQGALLLGLTGALALGGFGCLAAAGAGETRRATEAWWQGIRETQTPWGLVQQGRSLRHNNQALGVVLARDLSAVPMPDVEGRVRLAALRPRRVWTLFFLLLSALVLLGLAVAARLAWRRSPVGPDPPHELPRETRRAPADAPADALVLSAMSALGMLFVSPVVWTHYFAWALPGLACLAHRRRLLALGGGALVLALASEGLRALGVHLLGALALYGLLAWQALAAPAAAPGRAGKPAARRST